MLRWWTSRCSRPKFVGNKSQNAVNERCSARASGSTSCLCTEASYNLVASIETPFAASEQLYLCCGYSGKGKIPSSRERVLHSLIFAWPWLFAPTHLAETEALPSWQGFSVCPDKTSDVKKSVATEFRPLVPPSKLICVPSLFLSTCPQSDIAEQKLSLAQKEQAPEASVPGRNCRGRLFESSTQYWENLLCVN